LDRSHRQTASSCRCPAQPAGRREIIVGADAADIFAQNNPAEALNKEMNTASVAAEDLLLITQRSIAEG
jgi:hypothetical protein